MLSWITNRWIHIFVLLVMLGGMLFVRGQDYDWVKSLRFMAFDTYNQISPRAPTDEVVIVDLDEVSLGREDLGQWPWPRNKVAELVQNLSDMGAKAIVFDMVFSEYDRTSPKILARRMPEEIASILSEMPDNDEIFADTIKKAGNVVTGFIWTSQKEATRREPVISTTMLIRKNAYALKETIPAINGVATNIPEISRVAAGNGCFGVQTGVDGLIRSVPLLFHMHGEKDNGKRPKLYPSLAVEALRVFIDPKEPIKIEAFNDGGSLSPPFIMHIGKYDIPLDYDGNINIHFSKARPNEYLPAWKVIEKSLAPEKINGKIVLIGTSAEGLKDIRSTPLNLFIPGVELHLNVIEQILQERYISRPEIMKGAELTFLLVLGIMIIALASYVGTVTLAMFTVVATGVITVASWHAFSHHGLLFDPVYPGLSLIVIFIVSSLLTYVRTEADRRRIKSAFGLYISPDFMKELTNHPDKLELGGEIKELTVMFTDIRSFTTISEGLTPEELIQLMNNFLTPMSDLVMQNRGTIDKYMGDAMMAFWNAPLDDEDHARHACLTALKMNDALRPINEKLAEKAKAEGKSPILLNAGIGINTGSASVGNMGSRQRFAYSALGDTVNLASRLEGQTKTYGITNLIGEKTCRAAPDFATLEVDLVKVKGKIKPERVYTLTGDPEYAKSDEFCIWEAKHNNMIQAYRDLNFDQAIKLAEECKMLSGGKHDVLYEIYRLRSEQMLEDLPGADWDRVYIATSK